MARDQLILDRYRLLAQAGSGGFSTVQVAWDTRIQRKVAIKCIDLEENYAPDPNISSELAQPLTASVPGLDEARTAALLTDPNIVAVYDFEVQGTTAYLIMEFIEGLTLTKLLQNYGNYLTLDMVTSVFSSIAHALEVAHQNQVLHLDIKPDNVLVNRQGQVKVADFGLAKLADIGGFGAAAGGTIGYMPLEQMRGQNLDARCDEWALAAVTYEMLTGANPFLASDLTKAEQAIKNAELVLPSLCWEDLDTAVDDVLFYALDPNREQRYDNITDFAEEMEKFLGDARRGHRELAVLVGDSQEDDTEKAQGTATSMGCKTRRAIHERLGPGSRNVLSRIGSVVGAAALSFMSLAPLLHQVGTIGTSAIGYSTLFWGLFVLVTLAGALVPSLGALLAFEELFIALVIQGSPAVGFVGALITVVWWYFIGRKGKVEANTILLTPLMGGGLSNQFIPLAAGYFLPPARAVGTTAFGILLASVFSALGLDTFGNLNVFSALNYDPVLLQAGITGILGSPTKWCIAISWLVASFLLSCCRQRFSRVGDFLGVALSGAVLVAGICVSLWLSSADRNWVPSWPALVPVGISLSACVMLTVLFPRQGGGQNEGE